MRVPRFIYVVAGFFVIPLLLTLISLVTSRHPRDASPTVNVAKDKGRIQAFFTFTSPSSLFPPSAIISLTDDNSTFFLARPAAFGPLLATRGLSGQLWVGSGFGDDNSVRGGGAASGAEGELGCSDVPGWGEGDGKSEKHRDKLAPGNPSGKTGSASSDGEKSRGGSGRDAKGGEDTGGNGDKTIPRSQRDAPPPSRNDGTDDYLHHPLPGTEVFRPSAPGQAAQKGQIESKPGTPHHADIQSLQEGAEIAGRIVLLSRGGCGFLEKVKWAQRRGGIALIVGDNTRGGGLVTMYAQADTSNVTIPSLFTSHTTAHLLSSLIPVDGSADDGKTKTASKESAKTKAKLGSKTKKLKKKKAKAAKGGPTFTPTTAASKQTGTARPTGRAGSAPPAAEVMSETPFQITERGSWMRTVLSKIGLGSTEPIASLAEDSRRPPSSGQLDWVLVEDWMEGETSSLKKSSILSSGKETSKDGGTTGEPQKEPPSQASPPQADDFVIGVQDWRDPDLVELSPKASSSSPGKTTSSAAKEATNKPDSSKSKSSAKQAAGKGKTEKGLNMEALEGGSITPGSGEYQTPWSDKLSKDSSKTAKVTSPGSDRTSSGSWFESIPWVGSSGSAATSADEKELLTDEKETTLDGGARPEADDTEHEDAEGETDEAEEHEGLWVTLTPTSMSSSPFFDTLLVLVVSPLVTLTVVYAMLLLRSRIRRRRWRAPKSVVERLPVRTYQAVPSSSTSSSSRTSTPRSATPPTPDLGSRSRPRSRTASSVLSQAELPRSRPASLHGRVPAGNEGPEKHRRATSPDWNRRYRGKQVECVVCLEEYVNGVSKVMRLPCGHEFHVDCITPWLTTRRRTCPICKGDVVRSLARGSPSSSSLNAPYRDNPDEHEESPVDEDAEGAPSRAVPIGRAHDNEDEADLERGEHSPLLDTRTQLGRSRWTGLLGVSLDTIREYSGSFGRDNARRRAREERDR